VAGDRPTLPHADAVQGAFGADFSNVRIHTSSSDADAINRSLQARAHTTGQDVFFRQGSFTPAGSALLGHALTHVVQQGAPRTPSSSELLHQVKAHAALKK